MSERLEGWLHMKDPNPDLRRIEEKMDPDLADKIYELDRCIECGCCVAACGTARMRKDFVGAVGLNRVARFRLDPRDARTDDDYYEVIGDDDGVFGCMSLLACHDVCPKDLPLATQIAFMRRKMVTIGWKSSGGKLRAVRSETKEGTSWPTASRRTSSARSRFPTTRTTACRRCAERRTSTSPASRCRWSRTSSRRSAT